jgi:hypothetical protein
LSGTQVDSGDFQLPLQTAPDSAKYLASLQILNSIIALVAGIFFGSILAFVSYLLAGVFVAISMLVMAGGLASYSGLVNLEHFGWRLALVVDTIWFLTIAAPIVTFLSAAIIFNPQQISLVTGLLPWFGGLALIPLIGIIGLLIPSVRRKFK